MKDTIGSCLQDIALDHIAYLVRNTDATISALSLLKFNITRYRTPLTSQQAYITMLEAPDGSQKIELVEPFADNSMMQKRLDRDSQDSVLYHICYNVIEFDEVFKGMRSEGWFPLTMPFEGLDPGRRASHLYHPSFGVVEIAEIAAL